MVSNSTAIDTNAQSSLQSFLGSMLRAREFGIFASLLVAVIVIGAFRPSFLTTSNLLNMGRQMAQPAKCYSKWRGGVCPACLKTSPLT